MRFPITGIVTGATRNNSRRFIRLAIENTEPFSPRPLLPLPFQIPVRHWSFYRSAINCSRRYRYQLRTRVTLARGGSRLLSRAWYNFRKIPSCEGIPRWNCWIPRKGTAIVNFKIYSSYQSSLKIIERYNVCFMKKSATPSFIFMFLHKSKRKRKRRWLIIIICSVNKCLSIALKGLLPTQFNHQTKLTRNVAVKICNCTKLYEKISLRVDMV